MCEVLGDQLLLRLFTTGTEVSRTPRVLLLDDRCLAKLSLVFDGAPRHDLIDGDVVARRRLARLLLGARDEGSLDEV